MFKCKPNQYLGLFVCLFACLLGVLPPLRAQTGLSSELESTGGYVKNQGNSRVLVFVHGLFSGPEAWRCDPNHYWPQMIAQDQSLAFAQLDVYVLKYRTPSHGGTMTLSDLSTSIYNQMVTDGIFSKHKEVIFVAHSMGGILTQQLLITYAKEKLSDKVRTILLYGTPQEGSKLANLGSLFNKDPLLKELQTGDRNFILPEMDLNWTHSTASLIRRYCAYETRAEGFMKVVDPRSATRGCYDKLAVDTDHRHLVKPCSVRDASYTFLANKLTEMGVPGQLPASPETGTTVPAPAREIAHNTPYDEIGNLLDTVRSMQALYGDETMRISQDFASPYKSGKPFPMPPVLPDELYQRMLAADRGVGEGFSYLQTGLLKARQDAIACLQLTPNELEKEQLAFHKANMLALRPTPVDQLEHNSPGLKRFGDLMNYLASMHEKLADYRCGMY